MFTPKNHHKNARSAREIAAKINKNPDNFYWKPSVTPGKFRLFRRSDGACLGRYQAEFVNSFMTQNILPLARYVMKLRRERNAKPQNGGA